jgi:hypothetical protein
MKKLSKEQAIVITGFPGVTAVSFGDFHQDVERRLGRPVFTHEFASSEFEKEIKELYREDFLEMCDVDNNA